MAGRPRELLVALRSGGARAGLLVLVASLVGHVANYLFSVLAARSFTPADFAALSALMALGAIALTPSTGVQATVARDVAGLVAQGRADEVPGLLASTGRRLLRVEALLAGVLLLGTPLALSLLDLDGPLVWAAAVLWMLLAIAMQTGLGAVQGLGRFGPLAFVLGGPQGALRPLLLVPLAAAGVLGAVGALLVATVVGLLVVARSLLRLPRAVVRGTTRLQSPALAVVALLAFASLTNADLVVAKIALDGDRAGQYASAALIGKIALYAPSALSTVLLPKVTARLEAGLDIAVPVLLTMVAAVGTGLVVLAALVLAPASLITALFGEAYAGAATLAVPLAAVMTLCALLNVQVVLAVATRDTRFLRVLAGAAVAHGVLLLVLGRSTTGIVTATAVAAGLAVLLHELTSPNALRRLLAAPRSVA